jgi:hypothetical protein
MSGSAHFKARRHAASACDPAAAQVSSRSDSSCSASAWRRMAIALGPMPWSLSRSTARWSVSCERRVMPMPARARVAGAPMRGSSSGRVVVRSFRFVGSHGETGTPDGTHRCSGGAPSCARYARAGTLDACSFKPPTVRRRERCSPAFRSRVLSLLRRRTAGTPRSSQDRPVAVAECRNATSGWAGTRAGWRRDATATNGPRRLSVV